MKIIFILLLGLLITIPSAFGIPISDKTGMKFLFPVNVDGDYFSIEGTANFDAKRLDFDADNKKINLKIESSLEENVMEIVIPKNLLKGDHLTFMITSVPISITSQLSNTMAPVIPKIIHHGENNIFAILEFIGIGTHYLSVSGSIPPDSFEIIDELDYDVNNALVDSVEAIPKQNSLIVTLSEVIDDGELLITLNNVITPFSDETFYVLVNEEETDYVFEDGIMTIQFHSQAETIEIVGTHVVPEFAEIAPIMLATSLIVIIAMQRYKKLHFNSSSTF